MVNFNEHEFSEFCKYHNISPFAQEAVYLGWKGALMSIGNKNEAEITNLLSREKTLLRDKSNLERQVAELQKEVKHWKSNHDIQVKVARVLKERDDIPVERAQFYEDYKRVVKDNEILKKQIPNMSGKVLIFNDIINVENPDGQK